MRNRDTSQKNGKAALEQARRLFLYIFLGAGALLAGAIAVVYQMQTQGYLEQLRLREVYGVALQQQVAVDTFGAVLADLEFLSVHSTLREMLRQVPQARESLGNDYLSLAKARESYDQIRFIDLYGREVVRVNFREGRASLVPDDALQNKAKRYYFTDTFSLGRGEIFVSPFDLNVEHGEVERPFKPMIRVGTPVFDSQGEKQGIVLLNYFGEQLLNRLRSAGNVTDGDIMLLNSDGYWLLSKDAEDEWGFMLADRADRVFSKLYPKEWETIGGSENGQFQTENGLFTFATIRPLPAELVTSTGSAAAEGNSAQTMNGTAYNWKLVSQVSSERMWAYSSSLLVNLFSLGAVLFLLAASGSWFLALAVTKRRLYQAELQVMAHYDTLTGLPNRVSFMDRLTLAFEQARRYERGFGLLYVDLDRFKPVNDTLGHSAGDRLLEQVAQRLLGCIRKSDTAARLGGDEFAVILQEVSGQEQAAAAAQKIISALSEPFMIGSNKVSIGASIGV
ncbi:MAG: sensor domain-containing diguanylate cyclase, partial [Proteobacteria bacterium]|nr:sensor domain-containing diguanylate cyclase [Pseudomonadota bacterium]